MSENRTYAGPHDAADLLIGDGLYATVLNRDVSDEQAEALGYNLDPDATDGRFARRTITVSDELGARLNDDEWPKVGGAPGDPVDVPDSHPALRDIELDTGETVTPAELDERVRVATEADEAELRADAAAGDDTARDDLHERNLERARAMTTRIGELEDALESAEGDDADKITVEIKALNDELDTIRKALA